MSAVPEHDVVPFEKPALPLEKPASPFGRPASPPRRVLPRASDADRQAIVRVLQDALARGQLTFEEAGDRMSAAWNARYLGDLAPLTADLPPAAQAPAPGWTAVAQLALTQLRASIATAFAGGARSARTRVALGAALLAFLMLVLLIGATAHALFGGDPGFGPGFGTGPGGWHGPHPHFGGG